MIDPAQDIPSEAPPPEERALSEFDLLTESWPTLTEEARREAFFRLSRPDAEELFLGLSASDQYQLISELSGIERRSWLRLLAPDDAADLIQQFAPEEREAVVALFDAGTQKEVRALLAYAEDDAGGLMNPRFIRLRPDVSVDVAIRYLRAQAKTPVESINYAYVLDFDQKLLGVASFRDLLLAVPEKTVAEIMQTDLVTLPEDMDQEEVGRVFSQYDLPAVPVVDTQGRMKGIVTIDDVVDVVEEEATEDIQRLGGTEVLSAPYLHVGLREMIRKRAGWLTVLFVGAMFTATAMGHYANQIERAIVLAIFIPLIISSGGNSGSQACTLVIRAMALGELRLKDWWRVFLRELSSGVALGAILGILGLLRVYLWPDRDRIYGEFYAQVAFTVAISLVGVVIWGTLIGSMLPFILRKCKLDPATASAPLVSTLVDITGIVLYFKIASLMLGGALL